MCESMSQCFPSTPPNTSFCYLSFKVLSRFYFPSLPIFETESLTGGMHKAKRDHEQPKEKYYGGDIGLEPLFWTRFSPRKKNL